MRARLLIAAAFAFGGTPAAAQGDTLGLADAVAIARDANPMLRAARLRADAMAERVPQVGALPDPEFSFALVNRPLTTFGTDEPMTMNEVRISQALPWPGKLHFAQERARLLASAEALSAAEAEAQLVARVKTLYYELGYLDRATVISEGTRGLLRDLFGVSQARYAVGEGLQQDVLQAQVAVARMTEDITILRQNRVATVARFNALLGRDAAAPLTAVAAPDPADPPLPLDSLMDQATAQRPALRAAEERVRAAAAGYRAARRELYPDVMVGLAYGNRPQHDDMGTLMLGFSLPIWAGKRQIPMRREMAAMEASEDAMARDLRNETLAQLTELRAEADRAWELSRLYRTAILPQARAAVQSALSAYRVGRVDYMTLVESEMTVNRYEIELVQLAARYHQAGAGVEALLGGEGGDR